MNSEDRAARAQGATMTERDEVARRVAARLGRRFDEWIEDWAKHQPESAVMKLWNALLDAELRADKAELRIQELKTALREMCNNGGTSAGEWMPIATLKKAQALLSDR